MSSGTYKISVASMLPRNQLERLYNAQHDKIKFLLEENARLKRSVEHWKEDYDNLAKHAYKLSRSFEDFWASASGVIDEIDIEIGVQSE